MALMLFNGAIVGLAIGTFEFTLGSFLIWGALIGVAFALLARWLRDAEIIGQLFSLAYTVVFVIWLAGKIF